MTPATRIAIIGAGHWGPNLIRNFYDHEQSEVRWVVDSDAARLAQVQARFSHVRTATDASAALADPAVDAVVIATPTITHYALTKAALEHGKDVLVEKPLATDSGQGDLLCTLARERRRVLMVGHVFLYNVAVQRIKTYLAAGTVGRVYYVAMERTNLGPIRMDVNAAWDLASHDISIVSHWLDAEPTHVSATGHAWINPGVCDAVFATLRYPNDVLVHVHASWLNPRKARDITVVGDKCMLTFDDTDNLEPIRIYDKQVTDHTTQPAFVDSIAAFRASVRNGDITIPQVALGEPLKAECSEFLRCVRERAEPQAHGRFANHVVRAIEAIERSITRQGAEEPVHRE
ncbi:MAG: Gfo/Idh/MocA family oxidoreductase [Polyangiales bacterium]